MSTTAIYGTDVRTEPTRGDGYYTWPLTRNGVHGVAKLIHESNGGDDDQWEGWTLLWTESTTNVRRVDHRLDEWILRPSLWGDEAARDRRETLAIVASAPAEVCDMVRRLIGARDKVYEYSLESTGTDGEYQPVGPFELEGCETLDDVRDMVRDDNSDFDVEFLSDEAAAALYPAIHNRPSNSVVVAYTLDGGEPIGCLIEIEAEAE